MLRHDIDTLFFAAIFLISRCYASLLFAADAEIFATLMRHYAFMPLTARAEY